MRAIPWIDLAVSGEADRALPALLRRLCHGEDQLDVPGALGRREHVVVAGPPPEPLDDLVARSPGPPSSTYGDGAL